MNEIERLKFIIEEKFKMIRIQIDVYKKKYGNNFDLYDKFIEKINKSLRLTSQSLMYKNPILLNKTFSSIFYSPANSTLAKNRTNISFYRPSFNNINNNNKQTRKRNNGRAFSKDIFLSNKNVSSNNYNILLDNNFQTEED